MVHYEIRAGAYYDSVVLMQLQKALAALPGVVDTAVAHSPDSGSGAGEALTAVRHQVLQNFANGQLLGSYVFIVKYA